MKQDGRDLIDQFRDAGPDRRPIADPALERRAGSCSAAGVGSGSSCSR